MPINYKTILILSLLLPFTCFTQEEKKKTTFELSVIPFQYAFISDNKFTPILNKEYTSFDINFTKSRMRLTAFRNLNKKWMGGIGVGFVQTKADWVVGFDKSSNFSSFSTINTYANQITFNLNLQIGYQLLKNTAASLIISPHFQIYSKSNHIELSNRGSFNSSTGFRADYKERKGYHASTLTYELQFKTNIYKSFFINYGINITKYGFPKSNQILYLYEIKGKPPLFEKEEIVMLIKIGGYVPFGYIGLGYKFNNK